MILLFLNIWCSQTRKPSAGLLWQFPSCQSDLKVKCRVHLGTLPNPKSRGIVKQNLWRIRRNILSLLIQIITVKGTKSMKSTLVMYWDNIDIMYWLYIDIELIILHSQHIHNIFDLEYYITILCIPQATAFIGVVDCFFSYVFVFAS